MKGAHLIAGEVFGGAPEGRFEVQDAASGAPLDGSFPEATPQEVRSAVEAAAEAFLSLNPSDHETRAQLLEAIASKIEGLGSTLVERACAETGLPQGRIVGERGRTTAQLRMFAGLIRGKDWLGIRVDPALPDRSPAPRPELRRILRPTGPVAVFGASNFPLAFSVAGGDTAAALAAGCPVVCKGHPAHPGTSQLVANAVVEAVREAGLPAGTFSLLHGRAHGLGEALAKAPEIRSLAFTGSLAGGRALFDHAASRPDPIPVFAEMGSVNPVVYLPQALAKRTPELAQATAGSLTLGVGQFCTNPGLLITIGPDGPSFASALAQALAELSPGVMLHRGILGAYQRGCDERAENSKLQRVHAGGASDGRAAPVLDTVKADDFLAEPSLAEELFGPAGLVVHCLDMDEALRVVDSLEGQLCGTLHGEEDELAEAGTLADRLARRVGRLIVGGFPTGVEVCGAQQHGGPWPASSDGRTTSVGTAAIERFLRPVCYQGVPEPLLPMELRA